MKKFNIKRLYRKLLWFPSCWIKRKNIIIKTMQGRYKIRFERNDSISYNLFVNNNYELKMMEKIINFLVDDEYIKKKKVFFDIGANMGTTTISAQKIFGFEKCISFEPDKGNLSLLIDNCKNNGVSLYLVPYAMGSGTKKKMVKNKNPNDTHFISIGPIETKRLDEYIKSLNQYRSVVWIDAQGSEFDILKGASEFIKKKAIFILEFHQRVMERANVDLTYYVRFINQYWEYVWIYDNGKMYKRKPGVLLALSKPITIILCDYKEEI